MLSHDCTVNAGSPVLATFPQCRRQVAEHESRLFGMIDIVLRIGIGGVEISGCRIDVVAPLGDRQRYDLRCGIGHPVDDRSRIVRPHQEIDDGADYLCLDATIGMFDDQRVEVVLLLQDRRHPAIGFTQTDPADSPLRSAAGLQQLIGVERFVRAMKSADSHMHDPGRDLAAVVHRAGHTVREPGQTVLIEGNCGRHAGVLLSIFVRCRSA